MPNPAYRDGRRLEYAAAADLRANGYTVLRTAGSPDDRDKLWQLSLYLDDASAIVAYWRKDGRAARHVEYARLWGRERSDGTSIWTPDHALEAS